ncbi:penicillin-binding protein [Gigaspora margarita]|uniref:Penicillin-binding protein n=1 Tax=Gigaspora margarita TaxID=4874 RepID=A0A8H4EV70_GIGMA|nr:penicillin-binding protein [Gigaspora margarita]
MRKKLDNFQFVYWLLQIDKFVKSSYYSDKDYYNYYQSVCGMKENNETFEECAIQKTKEEVNIKIEELNFINVHNWFYKFPDRKECLFKTLIYYSFIDKIPIIITNYASEHNFESSIQKVLNSFNILANKIKVTQEDDEINIIAIYKNNIVLIQCIIVYNSEKIKGNKFIPKARIWASTSKQNIKICNKKEIVQIIEDFFKIVKDDKNIKYTNLKLDEFRLDQFGFVGKKYYYRKDEIYQTTTKVIQSTRNLSDNNNRIQSTRNPPNNNNRIQSARNPPDNNNRIQSTRNLPNNNNRIQSTRNLHYNNRIQFTRNPPDNNSRIQSTRNPPNNNRI